MFNVDDDNLSYRDRKRERKKREFYTERNEMK